MLAKVAVDDACAAKDAAGRIIGLVLTVNGGVADGAPDARHGPRPSARARDIAPCMRERKADHQRELAAACTGVLGGGCPV